MNSPLFGLRMTLLIFYHICKFLTIAFYFDTMWVAFGVMLVITIGFLIALIFSIAMED